MKKKLIILVLATSLISSAIPVMADSVSSATTTEISPRVSVGACAYCGYPNATFEGFSWGPWLATGKTRPHNGHTDIEKQQKKYATVYCPNCGTRDTSVVDYSDPKWFCN
ncbi:MAG TPA: hypothetical protein IAA00_02770 [Candidatus Blautia ornithocaccae]|nr:hypothetical protein [Candidatus Blautia ornithocaccae]